MSDNTEVHAPEHGRPTERDRIWVFAPLIFAFLAAAYSTFWVSRLPDTREELIAQVELQSVFNQYMATAIEGFSETTTNMVANINALKERAAALPTEDLKAKGLLLDDLQSYSEETIKVANAFDDLVKALRENGFSPAPNPSVTWSLVGHANAAAVGKSSRTPHPTEWIMQPGNKLWLAIGLSLAFATYFGALYALTLDRKKRDFSEKMLSSVTTFWLGLAGGVTLPNM